MATENLTAPVRGPLTVSLGAGMAYVTVTASPRRQDRHRRSHRAAKRR